MNRFEKPALIIKKLKQHGYDAYFVGGSVRDYLIGREIGDIDIATSALPEEVMDLFERNVPIGLQHGTILVIEDTEGYEVTTFRVEDEYDDYRRPSHVTFVRTLIDDLKRRDFTMNAIAMTEAGEIIDPYDGQIDINQQIIRTVGSATDRFNEDALRMMRALRFVSTLGFTLHEDVIKGITTQKQLLAHIAKERLLNEMDKLLSGLHVKEALTFFTTLKIYEHLPFIVNDVTVFSKVLQYDLSHLKNKIEHWALLLYLDTQYEADVVAKNWRMSNKQKQEITTILTGVRKVEENGWSNQLLYELGKEASISVQRIENVLTKDVNEQAIQEKRTAYEQLPIKMRNEIVITGNDFMAWCEEKPGPWIQTAFSEVERAILANEVENEKQSIRKWFSEWLNN
ncbi:MAG: CCA tRNA nucleotidyltransferase [Bacillaceae bacterium]